MEGFPLAFTLFIKPALVDVKSMSYVLHHHVYLEKLVSTSQSNCNSVLVQYSISDSTKMMIRQNVMMDTANTQSTFQNNVYNGLCVCMCVCVCVHVCVHVYVNVHVFRCFSVSVSMCITVGIHTFLLLLLSKQ